MNNHTNLVQNYNKSENDKYQKDGMEPWKLVTLGGAIGVLMGAGSVYTGQMVAKDLESEDKDEGGSDGQATEDKLRIAEVEQDQSFGHAFAEARAEVGPGGVFYWHGGIYGTYYADEWNSMSRAEKNDFAQQVRAEVQPNEIPTPSDEHPNIAIKSVADDTSTDDVHVVDNNENVSNQDADVHIVGYSTVLNHLTVGLDFDGDGQADVAIIDMDDNLESSAPDVIIDKEGHTATIGEVINSIESSVEVDYECPNLQEGSPDETGDYPLYDV